MSSSTSVEIHATPARVWDTLMQVEDYPDWTTSMTKVVRLDPGPLQVGSRVRITQPRLGTMTWTVSALDAGRSFTWVTSRGGVRAEASHVIAPLAEGRVRLELAVAQTGPLAGVVSRLTRRITARYISLEAEGVRRRSEQD